MAEGGKVRVDRPGVDRVSRGRALETVSQTQYLLYFPPFLKGGRGDFDSPIPCKSLKSPLFPLYKRGR